MRAKPIERVRSGSRASPASSFEGGPILALEGGLRPPSAALLRPEAQVAVLAADSTSVARGSLFDAARDLMAAARLERADLGAIAVSVGPGSFTGVRVALGLALGLMIGRQAESRRRPRLFVGETLEILGHAAGVGVPFRAVLPWGRLRALVLDTCPHSPVRPRIGTARLLTREELQSDGLEPGPPVVCPVGFDLGAASSSLQVVPCRVAAAAALAELAAAGKLRSCDTNALIPEYAVPPDAVLPPRVRRVPSRLVPGCLGEPDLDDAVAVDAVAFRVPWTRAQLAPELAPREDRIAAGIRDATGALLGYGLAHLGHDVVVVLRIAVRPDARRAGHGHDLLRHLIEEGRRRGAVRIDADVAHDNEAERALYASLGFVVVGSRRGRHRDGADALRYSLVVGRK